MLRAGLGGHRSTLAVTCQGLSEEQLRRWSMPHSTLSLLGLVRHLGEVFVTWEAEVAAARVVEAAAETMDVTGYQPKWDEWVSLRWVFMQVIHEYARHNGHADLLREGVDGQTGA